MATSTQQELGFLKSTFPVDFPTHKALNLSRDQFESLIKSELKNALTGDETTADSTGKHATEDSETLVTTPPSTTADIQEKLEATHVQNDEQSKPKAESDVTNPFMTGLQNHEKKMNAPPDMTNKMFTENADVAHRSTTDPLVDLFSELEEVVSGPRLLELLNQAWEVDSLTTLKIIFNARSIHLGKSSRIPAYKCLGWLAQYHPLTLMTNLQWLSRPLIEKKMEKKQDEEGDMVMVEAEKAEDDPTRFDVKNGVAHGYWKDLLNILALSANGELKCNSSPKSILNVHDTSKRRERQWDADVAKNARGEKRDSRYTQAVKAFNERPVHRTLHLVVARLFAEQLQSDLALLRGTDSKAKRQISLCGKWAPSTKGFHDRHTFIVSSIAEIMYPKSQFPDVSDRETYLRHAREAYRKDMVALRRFLEIVEQNISAETFDKIKYDRVPSLAMNQYSSLFAEKDTERFEKYIDGVAGGTKKISGAVLLPSKIISTVRKHNLQLLHASFGGRRPAKKPKSTKAMIESRLAAMDAKVLDGQWRSLVQRIKDSGTLENSMAVCDVSGSMGSPQFPDGSCPMDSAIGLSLLLAEVTAPPFGGTFITFSENPQVEKVDLSKTLSEKVNDMERSEWGGSTDFVAVFERLILPMARDNKLTQDQMVKQIFVFSDMQFNQADRSGWGSEKSRWSTSYERIKSEFKKYGYEMPTLVFWNLAGGRAGYTGWGDATAPKPVTADILGTALVSGYSQGMLKAFLDNGAFDELEEEEEVLEKEDEDGNVKVEVKKKQKMDPSSMMKKTLSHKAYSMLQVVD